jgi:opacity protein-like surface antigen
MRTGGWRVALGVLPWLCLLPAPGLAFDPVDRFAKGTKIVGVQFGGGAQADFPKHAPSDVSLVNLTPRLSYVPWEPFGSGWIRGALEVGFEGWLQYYLHPDGATAAGLKTAARYHFLELGRLVPYLEVTAGAGGTSLKVSEIRSSFTFVLEAGAGLSYFVSDSVAVNAGYRLHHLSNGGIESPNTGVNAHTGVVGVSVFFR